MEEEQEQHRSRRQRYALRTIKADFVWRAVNMAVRLLSIPLAIRLLGNERYGLWLTASSVLMWVTLSQMGIGGGLTNEIGRALGRGDRLLMRRFISTGYVWLTAVAAAALILLAALSRSHAATSLLGVASVPHLHHDAQLLFLLIGVIFSLGLVVGSVGPICTGLQESYLLYVFSSVASVVSLAAVALVYYTSGGLIGYALAMGVPPLVFNALLAFYLFTRRHPDLRPSLHLADRERLRTLMAFGLPMLVVQCAELLIFNSANPLIAANLGVSEVPRYAIPATLFMTVANVCDGIVRAYHGGYCEAAARHDWTWIRGIARRTRLITSAIIVAAGLVVVLFGQYGLRVWAGKTIVPTQTMLACMAVYFFTMVCSSTNTVLLLGLGLVRVKAVCQVMVAVVHVGGFLLLLPALGLLAVPVAGTIGFLGDIIVSYSYTSKYIRAQQQ